MKRTPIIMITAGAALCLITGVLFPVFLLLRILSMEGPEQFLVPGSARVNISKPGRYYVWNDYETVFQGRSYSKSEQLPDGLSIVVRSATGKSKVDFVTQLSLSASSGSSRRNSIGYFDVKQAGEYELITSGDFGERVFSFGAFRLHSFVLTIIGLFVGSLLGGITGLALVISGVIKLVRAKKVTCRQIVSLSG